MRANTFNGSSILTQNTKMKKTSRETGTNLYNFGIPAYKTASGKVTCPFADACVKFCYAQKGTYTWSNVSPAFENRYKLTKDDDFVDIMSEAVMAVKASHIRIHDSGDFYSKKYIFDWWQVAVNHPDIPFYFYTKSIPLFKEIERLPDNMTSIYSFGSKHDELIDTDKDRHSKIFNTLEELESAGYTDCSSNDLKIFSTNKCGLILH